MPVPVETIDSDNSSMYGDLRSSSAAAVLASLRPHQWLKNSLLFASIVFSAMLADPVSLLITTAAFVVFCLSSSGVYLLNDITDREADRLHPTKRH